MKQNYSRALCSTKPVLFLALILSLFCAACLVPERGSVPNGPARLSNTDGTSNSSYQHCPVQQEIGLQTESAEYSISFIADWSQDRHPSAYPAGAHFSPLLVALHNEAAGFWQVGETASPGIEAMAETGATSAFQGEVRSAIRAGTAEAVHTGRTFDSPGRHSLRFTVQREHSILTAVSMIAPSPDWFVGVRNVPLYSNIWRNCIVLELFPYDAGTEDGSDFSFANPATQPQGRIERITASPFLASGSSGAEANGDSSAELVPLGRFVIVLEDTVAQ